VPRPFRPAEIRIGRPIHAPAVEDDVSHMVYRQLTDELMYEIRGLTGQDYVDTYATKGAAQVVEALETTASPEMPQRRSSADVLSAAAV
jgi:hypothetical protein